VIELLSSSSSLESGSPACPDPDDPVGCVIEHLTLSFFSVDLQR
jgi:hypothetical protein